MRPVGSPTRFRRIGRWFPPRVDRCPYGATRTAPTSPAPGRVHDGVRGAVRNCKDFSSVPLETTGETTNDALLCGAPDAPGSLTGETARMLENEPTGGTTGAAANEQNTQGNTTNGVPRDARPAEQIGRAHV